MRFLFRALRRAAVDEATTVAVLGGGQLGRMLGLAGIPLGLRFRFLDPSPEAPAAEVGPLVVGGLGDRDALTAVTDGVAVATYEWEGVPADAARFVAERVPVLPPWLALEVSQDRLAEKTLFRRLGIATADFNAVDSQLELGRALEEVGLPAVLKTRRGGYDGKGQRMLASEADADAAWHELGRASLILEQVVPFDRELSILAVRGRDGATECYPLVENEHRDGILRSSRAPAPGLTGSLQANAERYAVRLLDELDYEGVLAVELFQVGRDLVANELAPRVHNSGHWTIEGAETSQFENHLRAVLGWPLGPTGLLGSSAMVNCIGTLPDPAAVLRIPGVHLHRYGKAPRPGRKLGHVTVTAGNAGALDQRLAQVHAAVGPRAG
jgi:5-(carboxyamino)imidazole ribonucleotide synthase